jgi:hypothetical protein
MRIGVDFDNTIVSYDDAIHRLACEWKLIAPDALRSKKSMRDAIRQLPDGEMKWQKVQAEIYGPRMHEAKLIEGVQEFFGCARKHRVPACIISHKTEYSNLLKTGANFRVAAMEWMRRHGFFETDGLGLSERDVHFASTRQDKIDRIIRLQCTHFIDDLEETFTEPAFPRQVVKVLFAPVPHTALAAGITQCATWDEIRERCFGE